MSDQADKRRQVAQIIREEMELRGWSRRDLAQQSGITLVIVGELLDGTLDLGVWRARWLAESFKSSETLWAYLATGERQ